MSRSIGEHVRCPDGSLINGRFKVLKEIGCGNFAKVYKCTDSQNPAAAPVAVKILKKEYAADAAFEADILKALNAKGSKHQKVVRMIEQFQHCRCPGFVFGLCGSSLRSRKMGVARGHVTLAEVRAFSRQMVETLDYLHRDVRMVHTDLKPENILIDDMDLPSSSSGIGTGWTVADFGSASFYNPAKPDCDLISTRPYRSPEVVLAMPWSPKADIWSMGCIIFELYYGARLFEVNDDAEHLALFERRLGKRIPLAMARTSKHFRRYFDASGSLTSTSTGSSRAAQSRNPEAAALGSRPMTDVVPERELLDLLSLMLEADPTQRLSAQDLLRHPFLLRTTAEEYHQPQASTPLTPDALGMLQSQMERLNVAGVPSSAAKDTPRSGRLNGLDKENRSMPGVKPVGYGTSAIGGYSAAQSSRVSPAAPSSSAAYGGQRPLLTRDIPAAGKPSSRVYGGVPRW